MIASSNRQRFMAGLGAAWEGMRLSTHSSELRRTYLHLVAVLFLAAIVLDITGIWAVLHFTTIAPDASWWMVSGLWVLRVLGIAGVILAAPLLALTVVNVLFPFLGERVFFAAMRTIAPARAEQLSALPGLSLASSAVIAVRRLVQYIGLSLGVFILSFIPVAGQILGPVLQGYVSARGLAWELLDPYLDKLQLGFGEQRAFVGQHRAELVGFGVPLALLMAIPLVGPLLFGLAQGAAARLVVEVIETQSPASV
ncbi:MAG: EI24 domain-containing protein [Deltaproteobacteria bacterium]|nr:EI24 domain-containing protein [Deltaproteobacteria bacterium]